MGRRNAGATTWPEQHNLSHDVTFKAPIRSHPHIQTHLRSSHFPCTAPSSSSQKKFPKSTTCSSSRVSAHAAHARQSVRRHPNKHPAMILGALIPGSPPYYIYRSHLPPHTGVITRPRSRKSPPVPADVTAIDPKVPKYPRPPIWFLLVPRGGLSHTFICVWRVIKAHAPQI